MRRSLTNLQRTAVAAGLLLAALMSFPLSAACLDPDREPAGYLMRNWNVGDGLPQNSVTSIVQSPDGFIWLGTYSGLARFDGVEFRVLNRWNAPGLRSDRISVIYVEDDGTLWAGTYGGGLLRWDKGSWRAYTAREGLSNDYVTAILRGRDGRLWVGTEDGLNAMAGHEFTSYTAWHGLAGNSITSLAEDAEGRLWIGALDGGLSVLEKPGTAEFRPYEEIPARVISALVIDGDGRLWAGTPRGLYVLQPSGAIHYSVEEGLSRNSVSALRADRNGDIWVGFAGGGLDRLHGGAFQSLVEALDFPDDPVRAIFQDLDGSIWVGTDTEGLFQIKDPLIGVISARDGLPAEKPLVVLEDSRGDLWVGTDGGGLCLVRGGKAVRVFDAASGLPSGRVRCLCEDRTGDLWIGTAEGLSRLRAGALSTFDRGDGLSSDDVTALVEDRSGTLWIGTAEGLNRLRDGRIRTYDRTSTLGNTSIRTLLEDDAGVLYVGTRDGLVKFYQNTPLPLYLNEEGMEPDVLSIYMDGEGVLWVGTDGSGLIRYTETEAFTYTARDGLIDNHIFSISEDGDGDLWLSSYVGVFRIAKSRLIELAGGAATGLAPSLYDEVEGMPNRHCVYEGEPSVCKGRDGRLYYPTIEGIAVLDPRLLKRRHDPPPVIIDEMLVDNVPLAGPSPVLEERPHVLQFNFTALDFQSPAKLRFDYKLEGFDEDWVHLDLGSPRTAYYFNLDPGKYRFMVRATSNDGARDAEGAYLDFRIRRPLMRNPWFLIIIAAAVAAAWAAHLLSRRAGRKKPEKYSTSALPPERIEEVLPKLERLMEEEKVFLDPELSLQALARKLGIHYNYLSRIINERFGKSYNDYVNGYRIGEAERMLTDPGNRDQTILDIAYATGFYSKSVFNTAFKKITGMTPSQYRKRKS
jgi:ligand-binding sensor domain-containing protein/AraC-like DNA-binding protein